MIFAPLEIQQPAPPAPIPGPYDGTTYYGLPAIKHSHYRWLISAYFFVGGLASAAQFLATVIDLFGSEADRPAVRAGRYTALLGALVSPPLLILDLQTPQRWYNMLRIFRKQSAMSIGSWALASFGALSGLAAFGQALEDLWGWQLGRWISRVAGLPAALMAGIVSIYTGTLLAATNVPLWMGGFPLISALFASSAASTAVAALTLLTPQRHASTHRRLGWFGLVAGLAELFFAARIDRRWKRYKVDQPVRRLPLNLAWIGGVFGLGILAPLLLHLFQATGGQPSRRAANLGSLAALLGGFCLRTVFILGGKPSADNPRDYFRLAQAGPITQRRSV